MKKAVKRTLFALGTALVVLLVALPFAVPPLVQDLAVRKLAEFGVPSAVKMTLGYVWHKGPEIAGTLAVSVNGTPWTVRADFGAGFGEYHARVKLPETRFSETDPLLADLLRRYPVPAVSNLTFSGSIALDASVERTRSLPVPVWTAKVPIRDVRIALVTDDKPIAIDGLSLAPGASGIASHLDIAPLFPRAASIAFDGFVLTNFSASVRATEKTLMVNEATAGFCGGKVSLYSVFLDPKKMNAGLTLFLDDVDAGEALTHFNGFRGDASGRLHGKIRLFVREGGKAIRLSDAFLYSTPGEGGKLRMENADAITDNLALAGFDDAARGNVATALNDLDYTVLRLDLKRLDGREATLGVRIEGTATRGGLTVPVNLTVNINGELEQIINTGLGYSNLLKGKQK